MKKVVIAALLSAFAAAPAVADSNVGISYGFDMDGTFGLQGEFDISSMLQNQPVSVQVFWKRASWNTWGASVTDNAFGAAGIYNFSSALKLDKRIQPYLGLGIAHETVDTDWDAGYYGWGWGRYSVSASTTDLYVTGGVRYLVTPQLSADLSYNTIGGVTLGANFHF